MRDCDVMVVTAGVGGGPGQSRLELVKTNARIVADIGRQLHGGRGVLVVVTNPVDIMTLVLARVSGGGARLTASLPPPRFWHGPAPGSAPTSARWSSRLARPAPSVHVRPVAVPTALLPVYSTRMEPTHPHAHPPA